MDQLLEIAASLLPAERKKFAALLTDASGKRKRKDLSLFMALTKEEVGRGKAAARQLYDKPNLNAYHSVRKRLMQHLVAFMAGQHHLQSTPERQQVADLYAAGQFLIARDATAGASALLSKATRLAGDQQMWNEMDDLLSFQVQHAHVLGLEVAPLIAQWEENKRKKESADKMRMALGMIRNQLAHARSSGNIPSLESITRQAFKQIDIGKEARQDIGFMHLLLTMARSAVLPTRDYWRFEQFAVRTWSHFSRIDKADPDVILDILYMIAHVKYRGRKFSEAQSYLDQMNHHLAKLSGARYSVHFGRMTLLHCALRAYGGDHSSAIQLLRQTLTDRTLKFSIAHRLNMQINLCVYLFHSRKFREANRVLVNLGHSDQWLEKKMGKEWRFKRDLIHVIIQVELGHDDIALRGVRNLERNYASFLSQPFYQRAGIFAGFIRQWILNPESVKTPAFEKVLGDANIALPDEREDIQAMTFYCWLKSK
ncbi:MAG: hypothetical protein JNM00_11555, partial [Flavobacteriales bacterium]|nr:hypothetical protein [Flavobacteriales bacterium]